MAQDPVVITQLPFLGIRGDLLQGNLITVSESHFLYGQEVLIHTFTGRRSLHLLRMQVLH